MNSGLVQALLTYIFWGFLPLFWKLLQGIPATQVTAHRIIWSWVALAFIVALTKQWRELGSSTSRRILGIYTVAAVLIGVNWGVYIWAVNANQIVQTSLGFFISPLFSVFLGAVFFKENLRALQWVSLLFATAGVVYLTYHYGHIPWIAIVLALTGTLYGLAKKVAPLKPLFGLTLETTVLLLPSLFYLILCERAGNGALSQGGLYSFVLLFLAGLATMGPLLLFAAAAQRIPLTVFGILQYVSPSIQISLGIFLFHEPFSTVQLTGFGLVWIGLLLFIVEGLIRRPQPVAVSHTERI